MGMMTEGFLPDDSCFLHEACGEGKLGGLRREKEREINVLKCGRETHQGKLPRRAECPLGIHGENFKGGHRASCVFTSNRVRQGLEWKILQGQDVAKQKQWREGKG